MAVERGRHHPGAAGTSRRLRLAKLSPPSAPGPSAAALRACAACAPGGSRSEYDCPHRQCDGPQTFSQFDVPSAPIWVTSVHSRSLNYWTDMPATQTPARPRLGRRLLGSSFVDLLVGPHGIDRYLELIRPHWTIGESRAGGRDAPAAPSSVTLTLRPNAALDGLPSRAVRPAHHRDRRRAAQPLLLARLLGHAGDGLLELGSRRTRRASSPAPRRTRRRERSSGSPPPTATSSFPPNAPSTCC